MAFQYPPADRGISGTITHVAHNSGTDSGTVLEFIRDHFVNSTDYTYEIMAEYFQPHLNEMNMRAQDVNLVLQDIHNSFVTLFNNHLNFAHESDRRTAIQNDIMRAVRIYPSQDARASLVSMLSPNPQKMYDKLRGLTEDMIKDHWRDFIIDQFKKYMANKTQDDANAMLAAYMDMSVNLNMSQPKLEEFSKILSDNRKEFLEQLTKKFDKQFTGEIDLKTFTNKLLESFKSPWEEGLVWERLVTIVKDKAEGKAEKKADGDKPPVLLSGGPKKQAAASAPESSADLKDAHDKKPPEGPGKTSGAPKR